MLLCLSPPGFPLETEVPPLQIFFPFCYTMIFLSLTLILFLHTLLLNYTLNLNLQATKLFIVTSATKGGGYHPLRFSVRFKIS